MTKKDQVYRNPWRGKHGPLLIAEIGGNHEGDFQYAKKLTDLAIRSGADYVKFQLYRGSTFVSAVESPERIAHFEKFQLSKNQHIELAETCLEAGVGYLSSVWDLEMLDWVDQFLDIYKIGSGDLTAYPIIAEFANRGKPIILSTGLSTLDEVISTVKFLQAINPIYEKKEMLALLQCTSMYPIDQKDANLRVMDTLRVATGLAAGYSDHTVGSMALEVAAIRGADVLEFHFTDERHNKTFRDHAVSLTCAEVQVLCQYLEKVEGLMVSPEKRPLDCETTTGHVTSFRRAVYSNRAVMKGEKLRHEDLVVLRPNHGVDARLFDGVSKKRATRDLMPFEALELTD